MSLLLQVMDRLCKWLGILLLAAPLQRPAHGETLPRAESHQGTTGISQ